jgi:tetratricopeptide (TPR) repeat protein
MTDKKNNSQLDLDKSLVETTHKVEHFYQDNRKNIFIALGVIAVAVVGYIAYDNMYKGPKEQEAQGKVFMAQKYFEMDSFNLALNGKGEDAMGFTDIASEYSGTKVGNLAHYYAGICHLRMGQFQEAIDQLKDFSTGNELIAPLAEGAMGDAYSELGQFDDAVKHYNKAAKMNSNKLTSPMFFKKAGLVYEEQKNYADALDAYTKIKNDYPEAQEAQDIDKYIARAAAMKEGN